MTNAGCEDGEVCEWTPRPILSRCRSHPSVSSLCGTCDVTLGSFCGMGLTCVDGVCAKLCCDDDDCGEGRCLPGDSQIFMPYVVPSGPHCVECLSDADCKDATRPACNAEHACATVQSCCESNPLVGKCSDPEVMACVCAHEPGCCAGGWSETCVASIAKHGCSAPCPGTCAADADCGPTMVCRGNVCQPACASDGECQSEGGKCDPGGHCGQCFSDADCSADHPRCDPSSRLCVRCLSDSECGAEKPHCQPSLGCLQCLDDAACPASAPYCTSGTCSASSESCTSDADCKDPKKGLCWWPFGVCTPKSVCCDGNAALPGCPQHPTLEACVCAWAPSCCSGPWDGVCDDTAYQLGCEPCEGGCGKDEDCQDPSKPACDPGSHLCFECVDHFDCKSADKPACALTKVCQALSETHCTGDDPSEIADSYPAGAVEFTPPPGGAKSLQAHLCRSWGDPDYYRVSLGPNEDLTVKATLSGGASLVLEVFDEDGVRYGITWAPSAVLSLTHLPAGAYSLAVSSLVVGAQSNVAVPYSIEVARAQALPCAGVADCSAEYAGQFLRASCDATTGACGFLDGKGKVSDGELCDSDDDCASRGCAVRSFTPKAHERARCARDCSFGKACEAGQVCTAISHDHHCLDACKSDLDCPLVPNPSAADLSWVRLVCDTATGRCSP